MGKCINHPDRETSYLCMKHNIYLCEECLKCRDPEIYCKFRSSCPIWFLSKRKQKKEFEVPEGTALLDIARLSGGHVTPPAIETASTGNAGVNLKFQ